MKRAGYSLLELMVALALSVLLLGAIYAGLDLFWRYSTTGQEEVERAQLARAVLRTIEMDLRSVVYKSAAEEASSGNSSGMGGGASGMGGGSAGGGGGGASGSSGSFGSSTGSGGQSAGSGGSTPGGTSQQSFTSGGQSAAGGSSSPGGSGGGTAAVAAVATQPAGLVGDSVTLLLTVSSPSRRFDYAPLGSGVPGRTSDLLSVAYELGSPQAASAVPTGLMRMEGDRLLLSQADAQGNQQLLAANTRLLASEVTALRFAYFDGYSWRTTWDSSQMSGLPMAVEVEVEITTPPRGSRPGASVKTREAKSQTYRLVVAIPLAKATDTSTIQ